MTIEQPPQQQPDTALPATTVTQRTVFLRISRGKVGVRRRARAVKVDRQASMDSQFVGGTVITDAEPEMVSVSKKILDCPEYDAICRLDNAVRGYMESVMLPTSLAGPGIYPVSIHLLDDVYERLEAFRDQRLALVDAFLAVYEDRCAESDGKLGSLANAADHPPLEKVRGAFYFTWQPLSFDVPGTLRHLRRDRYEREKARIHAQLQDAAAEIQQGLRQAFGELVQHMRAALEPTAEDGKKKRFYGSRLSQLTAFLERFQARNITDDDTLAQLAAQAQALIDGVDADMIRDSDDLRGALQEEFAGLQAQLDALVTSSTPRRLIDLRDAEEEVA